MLKPATCDISSVKYMAFCLIDRVSDHVNLS